MSCKILLKCKWPSPKFSEVHFQVWWAFQEPTCPCVYHNQRPLYKWVLSKRSKVLLFRPLPVSLGHYEPLPLLAVILVLKWTLIFPPEVFCTCQSLCQCPIPSPSWAESLIEMPPSLWSLPLACPTLYGFGHWVFPSSHFSFLSKCSYLSSTSSLPCKVHESRYPCPGHCGLPRDGLRCFIHICWIHRCWGWTSSELEIRVISCTIFRYWGWLCLSNYPARVTSSDFS